MRKPNQEGENFETCQRCQSFLDGEAEICGSCGIPTRFMSFSKRAEWEVEQWRRHKAQAPAAS
ncbi:MAG: hypothetical protein ACRDKS_02035 [Actinomycetota bacterium]